MKHNGAIGQRARQSSSNNFFVTELPTPGTAAPTASVFTPHIMNDSQSAGEGGFFSSCYKRLKEVCILIALPWKETAQQLLFGQINHIIIIFRLYNVTGIRYITVKSFWISGLLCPAAQCDSKSQDFTN